MELIYFFLENYFILSSFYFFAGMGTGSNTGKLSFRNILSGDNSLNISEDSNGLTFSYITSTFSLDLQEIGYGKSGGGLTSSVFYVRPTPNLSAIYGAKIWSNITPSGSSFNDSMVIGGCNVQLSGSLDLSIGGTSLISNYSQESILISGCLNYSCFDCCSTMIGGYGNHSNSKLSVMLGGIGNRTYLSNSYSSIIGSYYSCFNEGYLNRNKTIITSEGRIEGYRNRMSSIIGSNNKSIICNGNQLSSQNSDSNFILSGNENGISGGCLKPEITYGSCESSIIGGRSNYMFDVCNSSIIGGRCNQVRSTSYYVGYRGMIRNSTILNGYYSSILARSYSDNSCTQESVNITSCRSIIRTGTGNVIVGSRRSYIYESNFSFISNSNFSTCILQSESSSIISSCGSSICNAENSVIFSSIVSNLNKLGKPICNSTIIGSCCSCMIGDHSAIVGGDKNVITAGLNNFLTGGFCNTISSSSNSSILGGLCNFLNGTSSSIASGFGNTSSNSSESNIISGDSNILCDSISSNISAGKQNCIIRGINSNIVGGCLNKICKSSGYVCNSAILGGCDISVCDNNTTGVPDILYSSLNIVITGACYVGFTGTYSMTGTLFVRRGLITQS